MSGQSGIPRASHVPFVTIRHFGSFFGYKSPKPAPYCVNFSYAVFEIHFYGKGFGIC